MAELLCWFLIPQLLRRGRTPSYAWVLAKMQARGAMTMMAARAVVLPPLHPRHLRPRR